jgi:hypothetical protein
VDPALVGDAAHLHGLSRVAAEKLTLFSGNLPVVRVTCAPDF